MSFAFLNKKHQLAFVRPRTTLEMRSFVNRKLYRDELQAELVEF